MQIVQLSVYNLRSLKNLTELDLSSGLDVLIGQNDCGKSSLLRALQVFFVLDESFDCNRASEKCDVSFHAAAHDLGDGMTVEPDEIGVMCKLSLNAGDLEQAGSALVPHSKDGHITVLMKSCSEPRFGSGRAIKPTGYFIRTERYQNPDFNGLESRSERELIALMQKYPAAEALLKNLNEVGKPKNPERVTALLALATASNEKSIFQFEDLGFPAKGIPDVLWPEFSLIDTKTTLDGKHKIIEDAFKRIDSEIEKSFRTTLDPIRDTAVTEYAKITEQIRDYAKKHYIPQLEDFQAKPTVGISVGRNLILKRIGQKDFSHFDQQGDGTKRRMMVAILQVSANVISGLSKAAQSPPAEGGAGYSRLRIWAFDEPEMHLHPGAQRDLFNSLLGFKSQGFQVICSTHSTVFVNSAALNSVHLVELDKDLCSVTTTKHPNIGGLIKRSIGLRNSDVFYSNVFAVVEGATEVGAMPIFYEHRFTVAPHAHGVAIIDGEGCSEAVAKVEFLRDNLGDIVCLFDEDAKSKLGAKATDYEVSGTAVFIGTADFEDAFSDDVWLDLLLENYSCVNPVDNSQLWTKAILAGLRADISLTDTNKKFLSLIRRRYLKACRDWGIDGDGTHPLNFDKVLIGERLATKAIELGQIPTQITAFLNLIEQKLA